MVLCRLMSAAPSWVKVHNDGDSDESCDKPTLDRGWARAIAEQLLNELTHVWLTPEALYGRILGAHVLTKI
jgi:hypothetical protein